MAFSSIVFLVYFLPLAVLLYFAVPRPARNAILLLASLLFYLWGGGGLIFLLLGSIALNYVCGLIVASGRKRLGVGLSVAGSLGLLGYFKYANFVVAQVNKLLAVGGAPAVEWAAVVLPIGISFYTFQAISYVVDVARGEAKALRNPIDFAVYVAMFPQLVAGPIVRYRTVAEALKERSTELGDFAEGAQRFCWGLFKKVAIADALAPVATAAFALPGEQLTPGAAWLGLVAFTLQIYFDFSGYSDMAIGLGLIFGFRFPENFDRPYSAGSVTAFWRRWHMTLSNWFRDYLYIPLGGSRSGAARTYINLWIVFLATGLWHGAQWTFVAWGIYHGALLVIERAAGWRDEAGAGWSRRLLTLGLVMLGWVLFQATSLSHAQEYLSAMFSFGDLGVDQLGWEMQKTLSRRTVLVLGLASVVFLLPRHFDGARFLAGGGRAAALARVALIGLGLPYALMLVISGAFSAFIYFQF